MTFQIDSICRENTDDGILKALQDLPKDLTTTYRRILRRLRDSGSTDPLIGMKIFGIVSAARRPLNLEELREAISIEPGNTTWNASKLVNDVKKSLGCCGSLIVIDEELSTVHFAHSSVKQHLETFPDDADISEYHINPDSANSVLGEIIVTYLNLDVLQQQLTKSSKASEILSTQATSHLITTSLSLPATTGTTLARKLLKNRTPQFDIGRELEKAAGLTREPKVRPLQANSLLSYAQEHWLSHVGLFDITGSIVWGLFVRLVDGDNQIVKKAWTSEDALSMSPKFRVLVLQSCNEALLSYAREIHLKKSRLNPIALTRFINERRIKIDPLALITAVRKGNASSMQRLLDNGPTDIEDRGEILGILLSVVLWDGNRTSFEMLLAHGANVNAKGFMCSSVMEAAAFSSIGSLAVRMLLVYEAHEIPIKKSYPKGVKQLLQDSYELHKRKLAEGLMYDHMISITRNGGKEVKREVSKRL